MAARPRIVILYNEPPPLAKPDELDTLAQARQVASTLTDLGWEWQLWPFSMSRPNDLERLKELLPTAVFNLVEPEAGRSELGYLVPLLLQNMGIAHTGCSASALMLTGNKVLTKKLASFHRLPTPVWVTGTEAQDFAFTQRYLIKPIYEDASIGMDAVCTVIAESPAQVQEAIRLREGQLGYLCFAERYIDGREITAALLGPHKNPRLLPPAEMHFHGWEECGRLKILDYRAKWEDGSDEYLSTRRSFTFVVADQPLLQQIEDISQRCWMFFGLSGYARMDFRVDRDNRPWLIEINGNPCITEDSGFIAAATRAGIPYPDVIQTIINAI